MNTKCLIVLVFTPMLACFVQSDAGQDISWNDQANIVGGDCTPDAYTEGKVSAGSDACDVCSGLFVCDTGQTTTSCVDLDTGDNPFSECGTCEEDCGGTKKQYSELDCKGTFTTSNCGNKYTVAKLKP